MSSFWCNHGRPARRRGHAYGYWTNLLHPTIEVEDLAYGLRAVQERRQPGSVFATSCCDWPREANGRGAARSSARAGRSSAREPWLYTLDFSPERRAAPTPRSTPTSSAPSSRLPRPLPDDPVRRLLRRHPRGARADRHGRERDGSGQDPERHPLARLAPRQPFRAWAETFDLPAPSTPGARPTVEDAKAQGWDGGRLFAELRDGLAAGALECPFLVEAPRIPTEDELALPEPSTLVLGSEPSP